jgi:hypothetical protein
MHRDVMLLMSRASVASFLETDGEGSGVSRLNLSATSRDCDKGQARRHPGHPVTGRRGNESSLGCDGRGHIGISAISRRSTTNR